MATRLKELNPGLADELARILTGNKWVVGE